MCFIFVVFQGCSFFTYYECGVGLIFGNPLETERVEYGVDN